MTQDHNQQTGQFLRRMFDCAVAAADPVQCLPPCLPPRPSGRVTVVGAGKAAASMARTVESLWSPIDAGLVVTRYGHGARTEHIEVVEAAHPVPDAAGRQAASRILEMVHGLDADDFLLVLISGGGSALLTLPAPGLDLDDKQAINQALLRSGAPIDEMNTLRKHLSAIKGGRLAAAAQPARVLSLLISDVPGDDPAVIASGPTVPDPSTLADARAVLDKYGITPTAAVAEHLEVAEHETPKANDPCFANCQTVLIARPEESLAAAAEEAQRAGYGVEILGDDLEGEARELGSEHARLAINAWRDGRRMVILSGGETTVTVKGKGRGGRNVEYLAGMAYELDGVEGISAIACDTDGIDGTEDNAGAMIFPDSPDRARALGLDIATLLEDNDAYSLFEALDDLVITGPTLTNVNDFRAVVIDPSQR
jgi:hydroxypyruvate reductase